MSTHHGPVRDDLFLHLRGWQRDAYHEYFSLPRRDFLLVATPGAGKTAYALTVAAELLARREVSALTVVTPTEHLKHQWAQAAAGFGIAIDSGYRNGQGRAGADFTGVAVTYAQVAAHPALHRQRTCNRRTLVVFDEIHHAGDALSWGDAVKEAFDPARRRLALTGTPFRSDANPIPFVTYADEPGGGQRSASDYVYGYGPALKDGVVRPVIFLAYSGEMRWRTRAGDEITAALGTPMTRDQIAQAWRTALDPALEAERDHVLASSTGEEPPGEDELAGSQRERDTPDLPDGPAFQPLNASVHFDRVLYDGGEFGTAAAAGSPEEQDFLGLPGLLDPDQVRTLLSKRQQSQLAARSRAAKPPQPASAANAVPPGPAANAVPPGPAANAAPPGPAAAPLVSRQQLAALRRELNGLVAAWSHRTGQPHGVIHASLRQSCGGPPLPQATAAQIQARIAKIRAWALSGR